MAESYDLTEDNRGLKIARSVNVDLAIARNKAYELGNAELYDFIQDQIGAVEFYVDNFFLLGSIEGPLVIISE